MKSSAVFALAIAGVAYGHTIFQVGSSYTSQARVDAPYRKFRSMELIKAS
jgi:hypothetical protein